LKHCEVMNDFRLERYVVERAIKHSQEKFDDAELTAKLMYKLSQNQKNEKKNDIIIKFADAALEEFRFGLEMNLNYMVQKRVANARVIGELFAQRCLHADTIFSCLFLLLTHGKSTIKNNNIVSNSDNDSDPRDSIRVRIAAVLLEKCGKYFNRGWQKKKLDVFLTYFQRYKCSKILSMDVNNDANNIMRELRPTIKICETFAEANAMCVQMEEKFGVVSVDEKTKKESAGGLATLAENDEEIDEDEDDIEEEDEEEEEDEDDIEEEEEFDDNEIEEEALIATMKMISATTMMTMMTMTMITTTVVVRMNQNLQNRKKKKLRCAWKKSSPRDKNNPTLKERWKNSSASGA